MHYYSMPHLRGAVDEWCHASEVTAASDLTSHFIYS